MNGLASFGRKLLRKKALDVPKALGESNLNKTLNWVDMIAFGVGSVLGAGIFVLTGIAAKQDAGPAIIFSFFFDGLVCICSALCYAEFAARHPVAGSAFSYAYVSVGEIAAVVVGWALYIAYLFSVSTVARSATGYINSFVDAVGGTTPYYLYNIEAGSLSLNPMAVAIVVLLTLYSCMGMKSSSTFNMIITMLSLLVVLFVIFGGAVLVEPKNWSDDFFPFGAQGVFKGAATVFFAYLGFDAIANFSEEVKNPNKDLPIGIVGSLIICTILYIGVSFVVTGMQPYYDLDEAAPLSQAFEDAGWSWAAIIVAIGAIAGLTTTILITLMSATRVLFAMSREGLIPTIFAWVDTKTQSPFVATLFTGLLASVLAYSMEVGDLADVVSTGILFAFIIVCMSILLLRVGDSDNDNYQTKATIFGLTAAIVLGVVVASAALILDAALYIWLPLCAVFLIPALLLTIFFYMKIKTPPTEKFQTPLVPIVPLAGIIINTYMICNLNPISWGAFAIFLFCGLLFYLFYGVKHSALGLEEYDPLKDDFGDNQIYTQ